MKSYKLNHKDGNRYYWQFLISRHPDYDHEDFDGDLDKWDVSVSRSPVEFGEDKPFFEFSFKDKYPLLPDETPSLGTLLAEFMSNLQFISFNMFQYGKIEEVRKKSKK